MTLQLPAGPLSGPTKPRNRRRNPIWRFRRFFFVLGIIAMVGLGLLWTFASRVELEEDNFDSLRETTYICTGDVTLGCGPDNAANKLVLENGNREVVEYEAFPQHLVNAVVATEDKSFFQHRGIDAVGITRAGYQSVRKLAGLSDGAIQGGSTITQQYVSLTQDSTCREVSKECLAAKAAEFVQAVKYEQEWTDELGDKQLAKQEILKRYFNAVYFGRGADGIQSASRLYFDKDVSDLTIAESAYIVGLLRSPNTADASLDLQEADRRRTKTIELMLEQGFVTQKEADEAINDLWPNLIPKSTEEFGNLGEVKGSEYGSEYFIRAVRSQLDEIYPARQYYNQSYRVYTTLDPVKQKLAFETVTGRLDPNVPDMPLGSLVSVDHQGRIVAMMGGTDWEKSQVNLATGAAGGGSGFQPGSLMKTFALAEFLNQGYSPKSYFSAPRTIEIGPENDQWEVGGGGVGKDRTEPNHRDVYNSTQWSRNVVYAQISELIGVPQLIDMAHRMGVETSLDSSVRSTVLGSQEVSVLEMAGAYSTLEREGIQLDPVYIERIEDKDGNVVCWYPVGGTCGEADRVGEQALDPSLARQVNLALRQVVQSGTGKEARLIYEDDSWRASAGKTGTTQNYRDAWFDGFSCGLTTAVWMGYPGEAGVDYRFMSDKANAEREKELNAELAEKLGRELTEAEMFKLPRPSEIFGAEYDNIGGGTIPAEMWREYMLEATKDDPPCEELPVEEASPALRVIGQELLTTLLACPVPTTGPPVTNENGEQVPQTTAPAVNPNGQCLPYDSEGNVIELENLSVTTMPNPAGPVSVDAEGKIYDLDSNRIDTNGNRLDENGNLMIGDDGKPIRGRLTNEPVTTTAAPTTTASTTEPVPQTDPAAPTVTEPQPEPDPVPEETTPADPNSQENNNDGNDGNGNDGNGNGGGRDRDRDG